MEKSTAVVQEEIEVMGVSALDSITRAEIDVQIATAHQFPRSIKKFKQDALALATLDKETAGRCFYKLPRGGKIIEGPSVRLAEIAGSSWGNMRYGARIVSEDKEFIVAQGVAHDLEKNVSSSIEVRRRITNKHGRRYDSDMITVTANAACSIALRNAIFKVIPMALTNDIYQQAKNCAVGDASTLIERRTSALEYFSKMGIFDDRILATLGREGVEDIGLKDLETLTGLKTAIADGDITVDIAFPDKSRTEKLVDIIAPDKPETEKIVPNPKPEKKQKVDKSTGEVTKTPEEKPKDDKDGPGSFEKADMDAEMSEDMFGKGGLTPAQKPSGDKQ